MSLRGFEVQEKFQFFVFCFSSFTRNVFQNWNWTLRKTKLHFTYVPGVPVWVSTAVPDDQPTSPPAWLPVGSWTEISVSWQSDCWMGTWMFDKKGILYASEKQQEEGKSLALVLVSLRLCTWCVDDVRDVLKVTAECKTVSPYKTSSSLALEDCYKWHLLRKGIICAQTCSSGRTWILEIVSQAAFNEYFVGVILRVCAALKTLRKNFGRQCIASGPRRCPLCLLRHYFVDKKKPAQFRTGKIRSLTVKHIFISHERFMQCVVRRTDTTRFVYFEMNFHFSCRNELMDFHNFFGSSSWLIEWQCVITISQFGACHLT